MADRYKGAREEGGRARGSERKASGRSEREGTRTKGNKREREGQILEKNIDVLVPSQIEEEEGEEEEDEEEGRRIRERERDKGGGWFRMAGRQTTRVAKP